MSKLAKALTAAAGNAGGGALYVEDVFSTFLYTGNGSTQTITNGIDLDGEGGLVWIKRRDSSGNNYVFDSAQSAFVEYLVTNATSSSASSTPPNWITASATGFDIDPNWGTALNGTGQDMASWTFRKAEKFFDVVTYTGTDSAGLTIPHNLGSAPAVMFVKSASQSSNWYVYHISTGNEGVLLLNTTNSVFTGQSDAWNSTTPTDSNFQLGNAVAVNTSGQTYVAYLLDRKSVV